MKIRIAPGAAKQSWRLQQRARSTSGDDEPQTAVSRACALILGRNAPAN
jgi:hypothetical protein